VAHQRVKHRFDPRPLSAPTRLRPTPLPVNWARIGRVHAPQRVVREGERVERIVVSDEQGERPPAAPRRFKLLFSCRVPGKMVEESQRLVGVLGGAGAQVRPLAARIDRHAEDIQVRQVQRLFIGARPRLYPPRFYPRFRGAPLF